MTEHTAELAEVLGAAVPGGVLTDREDLIAYGFDGTFYEHVPPLVVLPATTAEVSAVHRIASARRLTITPRAMGSGLSGGAVPLGGSIVLGVSRMDRILEIDEVDRVAVVQAGVINARLQAEVERRGLFYPPDPSSLRQSAIGGNVAENAGGARCLKYGVTGDYVLALEVVLPDGTVIRTGGRTVKNVTGYDLRRLFTGAEGTLGTITEITLRLLSKPRFARAALATFARIDDAAAAATAVMAAGVLPSAIELLDAFTMRCVEENSPIGLPLDADAILIFGVDGNHEEVLAEELRAIDEIARTHGATDVRVARSDAEAELLWAARRSISPALARRTRNKLGEDVCIPPRNVAEFVRRVRAIGSQYELEMPIFGHVGDGNLHPNILCDRRDPRADGPRHGSGARHLRSRGRAGRDAVRRARHRPAQEAVHGARSRPRRDPGDARDQGRDRSARHHEPRQGVPRPGRRGRVPPVNTFASLLSGGDPRKLHGVASVIDDVLHDPGRFGEVVACLADDDAVVRMRAADAAEKVTRDAPELLQAHVAMMVELASRTEQPSIRWHLAQMIPRATLDPNQQRTAIAAFRRYLDDKSAIVKVTALQALADLAQRDPSLRRMVIPAIRNAMESGTAAVRSRGERLLDILERHKRA